MDFSIILRTKKVKVQQKRLKILLILIEKLNKFATSTDKCQATQHQNTPITEKLTRISQVQTAMAGIYGPKKTIGKKSINTSRNMRILLKIGSTKDSPRIFIQKIHDLLKFFKQAISNLAD